MPIPESDHRRRGDIDGGDVIFFGDLGGNFYALNAANGQKLWGEELGGAIGARARSAKGRRGDRLYALGVANEDRDRQDVLGLDQRLRESVRSSAAM